MLKVMPARLRPPYAHRSALGPGSPRPSRFGAGDIVIYSTSLSQGNLYFAPLQIALQLQNQVNGAGLVPPGYATTCPCPSARSTRCSIESSATDDITIERTGHGTSTRTTRSPTGPIPTLGTPSSPFPAAFDWPFRVRPRHRRVPALPFYATARGLLRMRATAGGHPEWGRSCRTRFSMHGGHGPSCSWRTGGAATLPG